MRDDQRAEQIRQRPGEQRTRARVEAAAVEG
jgi:hypothetical protein